MVSGPSYLVGSGSAMAGEDEPRDREPSPCFEFIAAGAIKELDSRGVKSCCAPDGQIGGRFRVQRMPGSDAHGVVCPLEFARKYVVVGKRRGRASIAGLW